MLTLRSAWNLISSQKVHKNFPNRKLNHKGIPLIGSLITISTRNRLISRLFHFWWNPLSKVNILSCLNQNKKETLGRKRGTESILSQLYTKLELFIGSLLGSLNVKFSFHISHPYIAFPNKQSFTDYFNFNTNHIRALCFKMTHPNFNFILYKVERKAPKSVQIKLYSHDKYYCMQLGLKLNPMVNEKNEKIFKVCLLQLGAKFSAFSNLYFKVKFMITFKHALAKDNVQFHHQSRLPRFFCLLIPHNKFHCSFWGTSTQQ